MNLLLPQLAEQQISFYTIIQPCRNGTHVEGKASKSTPVVLVGPYETPPALVFGLLQPLVSIKLHPIGGLASRVASREDGLMSRISVEDTEWRISHLGFTRRSSGFCLPDEHALKRECKRDGCLDSVHLQGPYIYPFWEELNCKGGLNVFLVACWDVLGCWWMFYWGQRNKRAPICSGPVPLSPQNCARGKLPEFINPGHVSWKVEWP